MILWSRVANRLDAKSAYQGGVFASVTCEEGDWWVTWWVGPKGRYKAPSEAKAVQWVERFAKPRLEALGRASATPGIGPSRAAQQMTPNTPEQQARYDAFSAKYVPPKRPTRKRR